MCRFYAPLWLLVACAQGMAPGATPGGAPGALRGDGASVRQLTETDGQMEDLRLQTVSLLSIEIASGGKVRHPIAPCHELVPMAVLQ